MAKFASALAALALYIGLLFDFGYFWEYNLNYFMLLSYKDHLAALAFFAVPCISLALFFVEFRRSQKFDYFMCGWIVLVGFLWTVTGPMMAPNLPLVVIQVAFWVKGFSYFFFICYLTAIILGFFLFRENGEKREPVPRRVGLAVFGFFLLIQMFGNFFYRSTARLNEFETEVTFAADGKSEATPQPAHLVRAIDSGFFLVLQAAPDRIVFVKKDAVVMLSMKVRK